MILIDVNGLCFCLCLFLKKFNWFFSQQLKTTVETLIGYWIFVFENKTD